MRLICIALRELSRQRLTTGEVVTGVRQVPEFEKPLKAIN